MWCSPAIPFTPFPTGSGWTGPRWSAPTTCVRPMQFRLASGCKFLPMPRLRHRHPLSKPHPHPSREPSCRHLQPRVRPEHHLHPRLPLRPGLRQNRPRRTRRQQSPYRRRAPRRVLSGRSRDGCCRHSVQRTMACTMTGSILPRPAAHRFLRLITALWPMPARKYGGSGTCFSSSMTGG